MDNKKKISISLEPDIVNWLDGEVKKKTFASRSHGCQVALLRLQKFLAPIPSNVKSELVKLDPDMLNMVDIKDDKEYVVPGSLLLALIKKEVEINE